MTKLDDGAPVAVGKAYDFVLWLLPKVENFPKAHRFTVGERLSAHGLDLLTSLVEAAYAREKAGLLEEASRKVNSTRLLLRMAKDLKLMSWHGARPLPRTDRSVPTAIGWRYTPIWGRRSSP